MSSLCSQLEAEKSRFKKMQSDLQRELNVAFDENTKLTSLLDGKVPKSMFLLQLSPPFFGDSSDETLDMSPDLIDSVELERTVNSLNQELAASRKAEEELRAQLPELENVDRLVKQVCDGDGDA